jgi:hypothetical protein
MGAYDDGGMTKAKLTAAKAAADAIAKTDAKAAADAARAKKLADMKAKREAELAEKSRVRREAAGLPANTGFWADRTGTSGTGTSGTGTGGTGQTSGSNSSFTTSTYTQSDPTPTPATPATVTSTVQAPPAPPVKTAPIDTVLFNSDILPIEVMTDLIFENIGGQELINIARNDIINGQQVSYQPIKNLSSLQQQYNPNNILSLQSTSDKYFANFSIKLENKIPEVGTGPNGVSVYIDQNTGDLIVETINMETDEQVEIEISVSGTIYEAEFGETTS